MGLICCHDCGKEVSENAEFCIFCGCPIHCGCNRMVNIRIPGDITEGLARLLFSTDAAVSADTGKVLWEGRQGETAEFFADKPIRITVHLGGIAKPVEGIVRPGKRYMLSQVGGIHLRAVYTLREIAAE